VTKASFQFAGILIARLEVLGFWPKSLRRGNQNSSKLKAGFGHRLFEA